MTTILLCASPKIMRVMPKYLKIKYLIVKDLMNKGDIEVEYVDIKNMIVNPLTNGLRFIILKNGVDIIGV